MNQVYFNELSNIPTLSKEEQLALVSKANAGDNISREKLINSHLKLVVHYAKQMEKYLTPDGTLTIDDLIGEGNIALIEAINGYNLESGTTLSYFAGLVIKRRITTLILQNNSAIRMPERKMKALLKLAKEQEPSDSIDRAGEVQYIPSKINIPDYLDTLTDDNDNDSIQEMWDNIQIALKTLRPREKEILEHYYGINGKERKTQVQMANDKGVSKTRINQLLKTSITAIKIRTS